MDRGLYDDIQMAAVLTRCAICRRSWFMTAPSSTCIACRRVAVADLRRPRRPTKTTKRPPLTPARIAELTAQGVLDLDNHHWYLQVSAQEWTRVYTLRADANRRRRRLNKRKTQVQQRQEVTGG